MVSSLSNILPINVVGTVSGTVASGTPTAIFSRANVQNVVIVTENPIPVSLIGEVGIGKRVRSGLVGHVYTATSNRIVVSGTAADSYDVGGWHDPASDPDQWTVPEDGLYFIHVGVIFDTVSNDTAMLEIFNSTTSSTLAINVQSLNAAGTGQSSTDTGMQVSWVGELPAATILNVRFESNLNNTITIDFTATKLAGLAT